MAKSIKELKKSTKQKKRYLKYAKGVDKPVSWSKWLSIHEKKKKRKKETKAAGGSPQTQRQLKGLSGSDYEEVMNRFYRKKK